MGWAQNAFFNQPTGGATDAAGKFYTPDEYNDAIREVTPDGTVTTFAGKLGVAGTNDGTGGAARFNQPTNLTFDKDGNMYVVDTYANTIRKITSAGVVTTLAGIGNVTGFKDGTGPGALFNQPNGICYDTNDNLLYVADGQNGAVRRRHWAAWLPPSRAGSVSRTVVLRCGTGGGEFIPPHLCAGRVE